MPSLCVSRCQQCRFARSRPQSSCIKTLLADLSFHQTDVRALGREPSRISWRAHRAPGSARSMVPAVDGWPPFPAHRDAAVNSKGGERREKQKFWNANRAISIEASICRLRDLHRPHRIEIPIERRGSAFLYVIFLLTFLFLLRASVLPIRLT